MHESARHEDEVEAVLGAGHAEHVDRDERRAAEEGEEHRRAEGAGQGVGPEGRAAARAWRGSARKPGALRSPSLAGGARLRQEQERRRRRRRAPSMASRPKMLRQPKKIVEHAADRSGRASARWRSPSSRSRASPPPGRARSGRGRSRGRARCRRSRRSPAGCVPAISTPIDGANVQMMLATTKTAEPADAAPAVARAGPTTGRGQAGRRRSANR